jgi:trimeric autotransporter adhesin
MMKTFLLLSSAAVLAAQQYTISTFAGGAPPPTPIAAVSESIAPYLGLSAEDGNVYFSAANCVFKIDTNGVLTRVAGNSRWGVSGDGGPATSAEFSMAGAVAADHLGNVYAVDTNAASGLVGDAAVRKIARDGTINTVLIGLNPGSRQGIVRLAVDGGNNLYIIDGFYIRKLATDGTISTVAGNGAARYSGDGGLAINAGLGNPRAIAVDGSGNLYIATEGYDPVFESYAHSRVRVVTTDGKINLFAGTGVDGDSGDGGPAAAAQIGYVPAVAVDGAGSVLIVDSISHKIRKVTPDGIITSVQTQDQSGCYLQGSGPYICAGDVAVDEAGRVYIVGQYSGYIQMLGADGSLTRIEGGGPGTIGDGGPATSAPLDNPLGLAVDASHNVYIADAAHGRIRKVTPAGIIATVAGNGAARLPGDAAIDGEPALNVPLACASTPTCKSIAVDSAGNFYFADYDRIRKVSAAGVISTVANITWADLTSDGKNLYIADILGGRVLKLTPDGTLSTVAGGGSQSGDGGQATGTQLNFPADVAVDGAGNLYIAEIYPGRVRKVATDGTITTIAGTGTPGYSGDGGLAINAQLATDLGIAADAAGNVYIADYENNRVRKVTTDGIITTIAGGGCRLSPNDCTGYGGDGGPATSAQLWGPARLAVDSDGNVYISDLGNNAVRVLRQAQ